MNTDPNRHEASRSTFEAPFASMPTLLIRKPNGEYDIPRLNYKWEDWCRALDWQAAQVCVWKYNPAKLVWETECKDVAFFESYDTPRFCPACGRRVKIQQQTTPNQ